MRLFLLLLIIYYNIIIINLLLYSNILSGLLRIFLIFHVRVFFCFSINLAFFLTLIQRI